MKETIYISQNVKYLREKNKLSQEQFAKKLNVSHSSVSRWETEISEPSAKDIQNMRKLFNRKEDLLFTDLEKKDKEDMLSKKAFQNEEIQLLTTFLKRYGIIDEDEMLTKNEYNNIMVFVEKVYHLVKEDKNKE